MTRRIVRTGCQLGFLVCVIFILVYFLDNRFRVLPNAIHNHLPAHHPGLVVTDVTVTTCSALNPFSSCKLNEGKWHRIEKDLYLGKGLLSHAYLHVERKTEEELLPSEKVVFDLRIGRLSPMNNEDDLVDGKWESRPAGLWIRKSSKRHMSDSHQVITGIDVLFGADAVDPRSNWQVQEIGLLLNLGAGAQEARLTIRRGPASSKVEKPVPRIRKDGKFKIMQAADLHLATGLGKCRDAIPDSYHGGKCDPDSRTLEFVEKMIAEERPDLVVLSGDQVNGDTAPDLVVLSGDQVNGDTAPDAQTAIFKYSEMFARHKIPYAGIFGNHDDEGNLNREESMAIMQGLPFSLSEAGPPDVAGVGNYVVEVLGRGSTPHSALTLYLLDTHSYSPDEQHFRGYNWIKPSQLSWFHNTAQGLKKQHKEYSHIHMDLAFIHIPLPEYRNPNGYQWVGNWSEPPTAPNFNSGFKDALVEEGIVMVSCGHDHVNDYCLPANGKENRPAIWMCYGGAAGFGGYGGYYGYTRRLRFFDIDINEVRISTYKRLEWGDTGSKIDEQIIVDGGKVIVNT